jgi:hypothetical protein
MVSTPCDLLTQCPAAVASLGFVVSSPCGVWLDDGQNTIFQHRRGYLVTGYPIPVISNSGTMRYNGSPGVNTRLSVRGRRVYAPDP